MKRDRDLFGHKKHFKKMRSSCKIDTASYYGDHMSFFLNLAVYIQVLFKFLAIIKHKNPIISSSI